MSERTLLKYFTEADLQPSPGRVAPGADIDLLSTDELKDLQLFSEALAQHREASSSHTELAEKPHLRTFLAFVRALGALQVDELGDKIRFRLSGQLAGHLLQILYIYLAESFTMIDDGCGSAGVRSTSR